MNYTLELRPKAADDIRKARRWYEEQRAGLGQKFEDAVDRAFKIVRRNPLAAPLRVRGIRRVAVHGYPYGVYYKVIRDQIKVIAVYHSSRDPQGWMRRN